MRGRLAPLSGARQGAEMPPCQEACPLGQDIPGYLAALAQGDQTGALQIILRDNPLPSVLGHVCHHPCQSACMRGQVAGPPPVRALKLFAAAAPRPQVTPAAARPGVKVAVIGSGPAGLAASWALARQGVAVTVFDSQPVAGGMLAWAIPSFRLPRQALATDLAYIQAHGVQFQLGREISPDQLAGLRQEYSAVILACGAPQATPAPLQGTELAGVWLGLDYLRQVALGDAPQLKDPVAVVGGGNVAVDAARAARRAGHEVKMLYRRDREQMPAYGEEVGAALDEGVELTCLCQPARLLGDGQGKLSGLEVEDTCLAPEEADGRAGFVVKSDTGRMVEAGSVILALGQQSQAQLWASALGLAGPALETGKVAPGVWAAGDLVTGPATVVQAMAGGLACARAIVEELS